ncbi:hypothetical protein [Meiothermus cerbereus]|uniref:hypothetical protein n=1 Tax=Meiothermus cerbereus TaxID=65552 RepID=UPI003EEE9287
MISAATLNANFTAIKTAVDALEAAVPGKQNRMSGSCAVGQYIRSINENGTVVCGNPGAFGQVREDASLRGGALNVAAVTKGTGEYCITFTVQPSQGQLEAAQVTLAGDVSSGVLFPRVNNGQGGFTLSCPSGGLQVVLTTAAGTKTDGRFSFSVPPQ